MSRGRTDGRKRPGRGPQAASAPAGGPQDLVPRPSKMRYVFLFLAGLFVGRLASEQFAAGPLGAIDLFMYAGLALSVAWAWRSWARRAMIQRHLQAQRRQADAARTPPDAD